MLTVQEVNLAYRLLLQRAPESEAVVEMRRNEKDVESLAVTLMKSDEFRRLAAYKSETGRPELWVCAEIRRNLKIWLDLNDYGVAAGVLEDNWEPDETNFLLSILDTGDLFLDVGANIGWFTILAGDRVGSTGRVIAFEARADLAKRLQSSVEVNGFKDRCEIHPTALGAFAGTVEMASVPEENNPGHSFMVIGDAGQDAKTHGMVEVKPLDSYIFDRPIKAIKIDVEGAEHLILRGGARTIREHQPILLVEIFPKWLKKISQVTAQDTYEFLRAIGYRGFYLTREGIGREIHALSRAFSDEEYFNLIFLPPKHAKVYLKPQLDYRIDYLERELAAATESNDRLISDLERYKKSLAQHEAETARSMRLFVQDRDTANAAAVAEIARIKAQLLELSSNPQNLFEEERQKLEDLANARGAEVAAIRASTAWKLTYPIRRFGEMLPPNVRRRGRQALKLTWWTLTLKLAQRIRSRRASQIGTEGANASVAVKAEAAAAAQLTSRLDLSGPIALVIDDRWPQPDKDGGSIDAINLVTSLKDEHYTVCFCTTAEHSTDSEYKQRLKSSGINCIDSSMCTSAQQFIELIGRQLSVVFLTRVGAGGQYMELLRYHAPQAKLVFNTVDLHYLRERRQAELSGDIAAMAAADQTRNRELFLVQNCDATVVVSAAERQVLMAELPTIDARIYDIPLGRDSDRRNTSYSERAGIGFIGGFAHQPNVDAVIFFLGQVWNKVSAKLPGVKFSIVGAGLDPEIVAGYQNVEYLGFQPDIAPWFNALRLTVAPLRYGAGMKGKVVSSLAYGVPCVGTHIAFEGMAEGIDAAVIAADEPEAIAEALIQIYTTQRTWESLSVAGIEYAERENSVAAFKRRIHTLLSELELPTYV